MGQIFSDPWVYSLGLGIGGPILLAYLTGRLPTVTEVRRLVEQLSKKDEIISAKDAYIKELVSDMREQNDAIRNNVVPTLNIIMQEILKGKGSSNG